VVNSSSGAGIDEDAAIDCLLFENRTESTEPDGLKKGGETRDGNWNFDPGFGTNHETIHPHRKKSSLDKGRFVVQFDQAFFNLSCFDCALVPALPELTLRSA
jgi:hypothetical protein